MANREQDARNNWPYWSKKRSFTLMEGMMLEIGVLPTREPDAPNGKQKLAEEFLRVCSDHLELMYASLRVDEKCGKEWEAATEDEAASKIISRELFDKHWIECKLPRGNKFPTRKVAEYEESIHPTIRANMLKMIIAMAIKGYSYDPDKKRSDVIIEIEKDMDGLGLKLGDDTIRKLLKEASEFLPINTK